MDPPPESKIAIPYSNLCYGSKGHALDGADPGGAARGRGRGESNQRMAAKKSRAKADPDFWTKMLSASKVKRVLERRGFDPEAFRKDYESDNTRAPRSSLRPSAREIEAVAEYQRDWDVKALMARLNVKTKASALVVVDRVMRWHSRSS